MVWSESLPVCSKAKTIKNYMIKYCFSIVFRTAKIFIYNENTNFNPNKVLQWNETFRNAKIA